MKAAYAIFAACIATLLILASPEHAAVCDGPERDAAPVAATAKQPLDTNTRTITAIHTIHDGDTFTCSIDIIRLGEMHAALNHIRIRLKGVRCYEVTDPNPDNKAVAEREREALSRLLLGGKLITVTLLRQTHDRYEGILWIDGVNVCDTMKTYPQGGN